MCVSARFTTRMKYTTNTNILVQDPYYTCALISRCTALCVCLCVCVCECVHVCEPVISNKSEDACVMMSRSEWIRILPLPHLRAGSAHITRAQLSQTHRTRIVSVCICLCVRRVCIRAWSYASAMRVEYESDRVRECVPSTVVSRNDEQQRSEIARIVRGKVI